MNVVTTPGVRVTGVTLTYTERPSDRDSDAPELVAFASFNLYDASGFSVYVNGSRLLRIRTGGYYLQLPSEPRSIPCLECNGRNADHAAYCNWCGGPLRPKFHKGKFYDVVCPTNAHTRDLILSAVLDEHDRRQREQKEQREQRRESK